MRSPGRVGWAWIDAASLSVVLGAAGFWIGGGLGAGIGVGAGGLAPLLIERATRKQEAVDSAEHAEQLPRRYGPAHLLNPGLAVVPFTGRKFELEQLRAWCLDERAELVRLVTGGGGSGKTRLAREMMRQLPAEDWRALWVPEGNEREFLQLEQSATPDLRLLLVVDYAEARRGLEGLLEEAARHDGRMRVLLLARHAGDWWQRLSAGGGAIRDLIAEASPSTLPLTEAIDPELSAYDIARAAIPYFSARLDVPAPDAKTVVISTDGPPRVLDLHAAALTTVLESGRHQEDSAVHVDASTVLNALLGHEQHYWRGRADAAGLMSGPDGLNLVQLSQVVTVGCLIGAGTVAELAGRVPGLTVTEAIARWLRELYPPNEDGGMGVLRPDRLAELHVTSELARSPELVQACFSGLNATQARQGLILLARASGDHPAGRVILESVIARFPDVIADLAAPREVMIAVANAMPYPSLSWQHLMPAS